MRICNLETLEKELRAVNAWDEFVLEVIRKYGSLEEYDKYSIVYELDSAFGWVSSHRRHDYWSDVYKKISKLNK